jgi:hypothetical protein
METVKPKCGICTRFKLLGPTERMGTCSVIVDAEYPHQIPDDQAKRILHVVKSSFPFMQKSTVLVGSDFGCIHFHEVH